MDHTADYSIADRPNNATTSTTAAAAAANGTASLLQQQQQQRLHEPSALNSSTSSLRLSGSSRHGGRHIELVTPEVRLTFTGMLCTDVQSRISFYQKRL
jgi:Tfp pilus tip-associated adhesin PilY1